MKSRPTKNIIPRNQGTDAKEHDRLIALMLKQQERNFKQMGRSPSIQSMGQKSELNSSIDYLQGLSSKMEGMNTSHHNTTLKSAEQNVSLTIPDTFGLNTVDDVPMTSGHLHLAAPKYGCMKSGGVLPTYKQYKHQITERKYPSIPLRTSTVSNLVPLHDIDSFTSSTYGLDQLQPITYSSSDAIQIRDPSINPYAGLSDSGPTSTGPTSTGPTSTTQRKTLRRTFRIGKAPNHPTVSVLISNRTMRKEINCKKQSLKEQPMTEVKKSLIKQGLIKVGTACPNDVLRKLYEEASSVCGTIKNHNPEVLVHNYFNHL